MCCYFFFFNDTATTEIYTLSLHDALPISRWATHGKPSDENAHPHKYGGVAVVHNGIIENHLELKEALINAGHKFSSETDTEIFAHLIQEGIEKGLRLPQAVGGAPDHPGGNLAPAG